MGDCGYDAEHNHADCRDRWGIQRTLIALNPRNRGRQWPTTAYRREMRQSFDRETYGQRWQIESAYSRNKRRLGSSLRARRWQNQKKEIALRVLTHNLLLVRSSV